jgi:aspartyl-tRNA synthetase
MRLEYSLLKPLDLILHQLWLVAGVEGRLPFSLDDASRSETAPEIEGQFSKVLLDTRLNNRIVDLRVRSFIFIQSSFTFTHSTVDTNKSSNF